MAAECAQCGGKRSHPIHLKALGMPGHHAYQDASKAGLRNVSEGRAAYRASEAHKDAYEGVQGRQVCAVKVAGGPGACVGPITPHHIAPRSKVGGLEAADKYPVIPVCAFHNSWLQEDGREWGQTHFFTLGNRDWPYLISDEYLQAERERTARL